MILREAATVLRRGGLVVLPTDTVYGLAAMPLVPGVEERLNRVKKRAHGEKAIPLLAADSRQVEKWPASMNALAHRLATHHWPGTLTRVLDTASGQTEGFRVPAHAGVLALLRVTGPLRVTSANLSGAPPALNAQEAACAIGDQVDLILDGGAVTGGQPSTVLRVLENKLVLLREGALGRDLFAPCLVAGSD